MKLIKSGAQNTRQHWDGAKSGGDTGRTSLAPGGAIRSPATPASDRTRFFSRCTRSSRTTEGKSRWNTYPSIAWA